MSPLILWIIALNILIFLVLFIAYILRSKGARYCILTRDLATNDQCVYYLEARNENDAATLVHDMLQDKGINSIILKVTQDKPKPKGIP